MQLVAKMRLFYLYEMLLTDWKPQTNFTIIPQTNCLSKYCLWAFLILLSYVLLLHRIHSGYTSYFSKNKIINWNKVNLLSVTKHLVNNIISIVFELERTKLHTIQKLLKNHHGRKTKFRILVLKRHTFEILLSITQIYFDQAILIAQNCHINANPIP